MNQAGLSGLQLVMRDTQVALALSLLLEPLGVAYSERRLCRKSLDQADDLFRELTRFAASNDETAEDFLFVQQRGCKQRAVTQTAQTVRQPRQGEFLLVEQVPHLSR